MAGFDVSDVESSIGTAKRNVLLPLPVATLLYLYYLYEGKGKVVRML
jgi:hypothetical protein